MMRAREGFSDDLKLKSPERKRRGEREGKAEKDGQEAVHGFTV